MLIATKGTIEKLDNYTYQLHLDFPTIFLDKFDYKISVRSISFESTKEFIPNLFRYSLRTTAVDKSPLNPDQEILSFVPQWGSSYLDFSPRNLFEYKIQLKEVHTADFFLACNKTVDLVEIGNLYIIFEITRDVRIQ